MFVCLFVCLFGWLSLCLSVCLPRVGFRILQIGLWIPQLQPGIWEQFQEKNPAASRLVEFTIPLGRLGNSQGQVAQGLSDNDTVLNTAERPASLNLTSTDVERRHEYQETFPCTIKVYNDHDGFDSGMDAQGALRSKWLANIKDSDRDFGMKDGKTVV